MKKLWKRITSFLRGLRDFYSYEYDGYLSQSDKAYLLLGALFVCLISIVATSWIMYFSYQKNDEVYEKGLYDFLNTAAAYTANLTDDEYQMVAEELRNQLAFTNFNADNDIEMYMKYIANTAESCPLDQEHYPYKYYGPRCKIAQILAFVETQQSNAPDLITFPIVIDSPNVLEQDNEHLDSVIRMLLTWKKTDNQVIVASIQGKDIATELGNVNIIYLSNPKNHLFNADEYAIYESEIADIFTRF